VGIAAAAVTVGAVVERRAVRALRRRAELPGDDVAPVSGRESAVATADGVLLRVVTAGPPLRGRPAGPSAPPGPPPPTIVFVHGFCVTLDSWTFQWADLMADLAEELAEKRAEPDGGDLPPGTRLICYDQRAHGRSGPSPAAACTIDTLAEDLYTVLAATAPSGPIILVGHSMGGMTLLALAAARPELFADRVAGVALLSTSAGDLARATFGLPALATAGLRRLLPGVSLGLRHTGGGLEAARARAGDLAWLATRKVGFGRTDVPATVVSFLERMIAATPLPVIAAFLPTLLDHDKLAAAGVLAGTPTLIMVGDADLMTPIQHSARLAEALPAAEFVVEEGAGHMIVLERPEAVTAALRTLVRRALDRSGAELAPGPIRADPAAPARGREAS